MFRKTAGDVLVDLLINWGVNHIYGMPGDSINTLIEALRKKQDKIRFIQVRHEEAGALAAAAYAKLTGKIGVCLAIAGPGAIHLLTGCMTRNWIKYRYSPSPDKSNPICWG